MKKISVLGALVALCLASCTKPLEELKPTFTSISSEGSVSVSSGETANVAFKLNDVRGNEIKAIVDFNAAEVYEITVTFAAGMESGQISVKAPDSIYKDTPFDVKVTFTDNANGRSADAKFTVKPVVKPLAGLNPSFAINPFSIESGETSLNVFTLDDVRGNKITAAVESKSSEKYDISVTFADNMEAGAVNITAPALILDNTPFDVKVTFTDAANSRNADASFTVQPERVAGFVEFAAHANCFVATPGSVAKFPLYKGNSNDKAAVESLVLSWQDNNGLFVDVPVLNKEESYAVVRFAKGKEGNAVLNGIGADGVVWSWHFWVCADAPKDVTVGSYTFQDRNIGAVSLDEKSELSVGVIYQYGRKDPFPGMKFTAYALREACNAKGEAVAFPIVKNEAADNVANSIKNPTTYYNNVNVPGAKHGYSWLTLDVTTYGVDNFKALWENGGKKSVYDPCPAGYQVASVEAWNGVKASTDVQEIWDSAYETFDSELAKSWTNPQYAPGYRRKVQFRGCIYSGLRVTVNGEVNSTTTSFNFQNCVGKVNPTADFWCADIDPDYSKSQTTSYFRGCCVKQNITGNGKYEDISAIKANPLAPSSKFNLNYALPVRCVKEK